MINTEGASMITNSSRQVADERGGETLQVLLQWEHAGGGQAHCLARAVHGHTTTVVLSELATNEPRWGLTTDPAGAAQAMLAHLPTAWAVDPRQVSWLLHHGEFSTTPDPSGPETLTQVALTWDEHGQQYHADPRMGDQTLLGQHESQLALRQLGLASVPEVVAALGWPLRW